MSGELGPGYNSAMCCNGVPCKLMYCGDAVAVSGSAHATREVHEPCSALVLDGIATLACHTFSDSRDLLVWESAAIFSV